MNLSAKMPAQMDPTLPAKMEATMSSDAQKLGGGSMNPPVVAIVRDSTQTDPQWVNVPESGPRWETADKKTGNEWELTDRKEA